MLNNISNSTGVDPLFTKYTIKLAEDEQNYIVKKHDENGSKTVLEGTEKEEVLSGRALAGSIGYSIDKKHVGWLHQLLYVAQTIHEFITGRRKRNSEGKWNKSHASCCHGVVITGEALDKTGKRFPVAPQLLGKVTHAFMTVDPLFSGVQRHASDYLRYADTTKFNVYVPRDENVRSLIREHAIRTSIPKKSSSDEGKPLEQWKFHAEECLSSTSTKTNFSFKKLLTCLLYNLSSKLVRKIPTDRILDTTSMMLADLMLGGAEHLKDKHGNKRTFFCCSYVTTILQSALFMQSIQHVSNEAKEDFVTSSDGSRLERLALKDKIKCALQGKDMSNPVSAAFKNIFDNEKFARADGEFFSSGRFVELSDKRSLKKKRRT